MSISSVKSRESGVPLNPSSEKEPSKISRVSGALKPCNFSSIEKKRGASSFFIPSNEDNSFISTVARSRIGPPSPFLAIGSSPQSMLETGTPFQDLDTFNQCLESLSQMSFNHPNFQDKLKELTHLKHCLIPFSSEDTRFKEACLSYEQYISSFNEQLIEIFGVLSAELTNEPEWDLEVLQRVQTQIDVLDQAFSLTEEMGDGDWDLSGIKADLNLFKHLIQFSLEIFQYQNLPETAEEQIELFLQVEGWISRLDSFNANQDQCKVAYRFHEKLSSLLEQLRGEVLSEMETSLDSLEARVRYLAFNRPQAMDQLEGFKAMYEGEIAEMRTELTLFSQRKEIPTFQDRSIECLRHIEEFQYIIDPLVIYDLIQENQNSFMGLSRELGELKVDFKEQMKKEMLHFQSLLSKYEYSIHPSMNVRKTADIDLANVEERNRFLHWIHAYQKTLTSEELKKKAGHCQEMIRVLLSDLTQKKEEISRKYQPVLRSFMEKVHNQIPSFTAFQNDVLKRRKQLIDQKNFLLNQIKEEQGSYLEEALDLPQFLDLFSEYRKSSFRRVVGGKEVAEIDIESKKHLQYFLDWLDQFMEKCGKNAQPKALERARSCKEAVEQILHHVSMISKSHESVFSHFESEMARMNDLIMSGAMLQELGSFRLTHNSGLMAYGSGLPDYVKGWLETGLSFSG